MYLYVFLVLNRPSFARVLNLGYAQAVNSIVETSLARSGSNSAEQMPARVLEIKPEQSKLVCVFSGGREIALSRLVGSNVRIGDEILLPASTEAATTEAEIYIRKPSSSKADVYQVKAGYAALPKQDRRGELFVRVQVVGEPTWNQHCPHPMPCHAIRDYFFAANRSAPWSSKPSFYYLLHLPEDVKSKELRLGYRIRRIELRKENASKADLATIERAYQHAWLTRSSALSITSCAEILRFQFHSRTLDSDLSCCGESEPRRTVSFSRTGFWPSCPSAGSARFPCLSESSTISTTLRSCATGTANLRCSSIISCYRSDGIQPGASGAI